MIMLKRQWVAWTCEIDTMIKLKSHVYLTMPSHFETKSQISFPEALARFILSWALRWTSGWSSGNMRWDLNHEINSHWKWKLDLWGLELGGFKKWKTYPAISRDGSGGACPGSSMRPRVSFKTFSSFAWVAISGRSTDRCTMMMYTRRLLLASPSSKGSINILATRYSYFSNFLSAFHTCFAKLKHCVTVIHGFFWYNS